MSNIMKMKDLRNKVNRDGFDLSRRVCMTAKVGEILPIDYIPCLPGDVHEIDLSVFTRTKPLQTAAMARLREYVDVYFVPYRLLWRHFDNWVLQGDNSTLAASWKTAVGGSNNCPYTTQGQLFDTINSDAFNVPSTEASYDTEITRKAGASKLLSYLGVIDVSDSGINVDFASRQINIWPVLAYQKIYQDHFRFGQWENPAPWTYNVDYMNGSSSMNMLFHQKDYAGVTSPFDLRYCNYDKDYFHGILPSPQYGDESMVSPIIDVSKITNSVSGTFKKENSTATFDSSDITTSSISDNPYGPVDLFTGGSSQTKIGVLISNPLLRNALSQMESSFSILSLRYAEMFQKWKEITLSSSDRSVKSLLDKHWNVKVSDYFSDMCEHVGGIGQNINIGEVTNTNLVNEDSRADIHGKGTNMQNGQLRYECKDYGILMAVYHCKPIIEWELRDTFDKTYFATEPTDYPIPEFDNIGMEAVRAYEFLDASRYSLDTADKVVGYAPRYINYKTSYDKVKGDFVGTLRSWVLPYFQRGTDINYESFKVKPGSVDNLFGVNATDSLSTDQLEISLYMNISSVRNLSKYGLPY